MLPCNDQGYCGTGHKHIKIAGSDECAYEIVEAEQLSKQERSRIAVLRADISSIHQNYIILTDREVFVLKEQR